MERADDGIAGQHGFSMELCFICITMATGPGILREILFQHDLVTYIIDDDTFICCGGMLGSGVMGGA